MKLYWFWSFNPQKVRLGLEELSLEHELVTVDLFRGEHRSEEFGQLHPRHRVPVLEDTGTRLWESNAILVYLGEKTARLWPQTPAGRADAAHWLFFESRHLSDSVGRLWFNDFVLPKLGRPGDAASREQGARNLPDELAVVEAQLTRHDFMLGSEISLVDCCYAAIVDAVSLSNFDLDGYPAVRAYLNRMRNRPAWQACEFRTAS